MEFLNLSFFRYLPYIYYGCLLVLFSILSLQVQARRSSILYSDRLFLSLCMLLLLLARLPSILYKGVFNVDETQMITEALTLLHDPVYWQSVDGTTIGPITSYLLSWPGLLHLPVTYATCRLTGTVLLGLTVWFLFRGMRLIVSQTASRVSLLFLLLFLCYSTFLDYLHCSSEIPALPILAYTWFFFLRYTTQPAYINSKQLHWFITGFVAGLIPFIKLQAVPLIAFTVAALLVSFIVRNKSSLLPIRANRPALLLVAGTLLPSVIILLLCTAFGVSERFYLFYIKSNLFNYSEYYKYLFPNTQLPLWAKFARLPFFLTDEPTFRKFFLLFMLTAILASVWRLYTGRKLSSHIKWMIGWSLGWLFVAFYSVAMPATEFHHHLWLVLIPISWLLCLAVHELFSALQTSPMKPSGIGLSMLIILPCIFHTVAVSQTTIQNANYSLFVLQHNFPQEINPVSSIIKHNAKPGDRLVVWGWQTRYHVDTQLPQGTSDNSSFRSMYTHSLREDYQKKYLEDIQRTHPTFFLDATGPNSLFMRDTALYRFENFPQLADYVSTNFTLIANVDHVRIYMRKDRAMSKQLALQKKKSQQQ